MWLILCWALFPALPQLTVRWEKLHYKKDKLTKQTTKHCNSRNNMSYGSRPKWPSYFDKCVESLHSLWQCNGVRNPFVALFNLCRCLRPLVEKKLFSEKRESICINEGSTGLPTLESEAGAIHTELSDRTTSRVLGVNMASRSLICS